MPIKKLRFAFDIPITEFLALIATRNDALQIDVVGDNKEPRKPPKAKREIAGEVAGLLEGPQSQRGRTGNRGKDADGHPITAAQVIMTAIMKAPQKPFSPKDFVEAMEAAGLNAKSVSPQLSLMRKAGDVKPDGHGLYSLTPQGVRHFSKIIKERDAQARGVET